MPSGFNEFILSGSELLVAFFMFPSIRSSGGDLLSTIFHFNFNKSCQYQQLATLLTNHCHYRPLMSPIENLFSIQSSLCCFLQTTCCPFIFHFNFIKSCQYQQLATLLTIPATTVPYRKSSFYLKLFVLLSADRDIDVFL